MSSGPMFVHSDAFRARNRVAPATNRTELLSTHLAEIKAISAGRDVWFPTFNYDFLRSGRYDVNNDKSQLGPISEFTRKGSKWRSLMPVFNVAGTGPPLESCTNLPTEVDPFGSHSVFTELLEQDGSILWYGAPFHSTTLIHLAETSSGGPLYRYDKVFSGDIITSEKTRVVRFNYHVRPMDRQLQYDWEDLENRARKAGVLREIDGSSSVMVASAVELHDHWLGLLDADPFALLDEPSRAWVAPEIRRLGRRFQLADFE